MDRPNTSAQPDLPARVRGWFDAAMDSGDAHGFLREHQHEDPPAIARARELVDAGDARPLEPLLDARALVDQHGAEGGPPRLLDDGQAIGTPAGPGVVEAMLSAQDQRRFAEVYRVRLGADAGVEGGRCALKVLRESVASAEARRRFRAEASALARLEHPGIARLLAAGHVHTEAGERLAAIAMQLVDGLPLDKWAHGKTTQEVAAAIAFIARAAHFAHLRGVVHRDIKPANILVDRAHRPILLDLGVARLLRLDDPDNAQATMTTAGGIVGTPHFMAPEQLTPATRTVDLRCDVYALGLVLYELLTGEPMVAIAGLSQAEALERKLNARPPIPRGLSVRDQLLTVAICAASPEPDRRHRSAEALAEDIDRALEGRPLLVRPPGRARRALLFARRNWVPMSASAAVLAALLAAGAVYANSQREVALARDRAEALFEDSRRFLSWIIQEHADDLAFAPATESMRTRLIDETSDTLDRMATVAGADDELLLELARGYTRLSELLVHEVGVMDGSMVPIARARDLLDRLKDPATPEARLVGLWVEHREDTDALHKNHDLEPHVYATASQSRLEHTAQLEQAMGDDPTFWRWSSAFWWQHSRRLHAAGAEPMHIEAATAKAIEHARRSRELAPGDLLSRMAVIDAHFWRAYAVGEAVEFSPARAGRAAQEAVDAAAQLREQGHPQAGLYLSRARKLLAEAYARDGAWKGFAEQARLAIEEASSASRASPDQLKVVRTHEVTLIRMAMTVANRDGRSPGAPPELIDMGLAWALEARAMLANRKARGWLNALELDKYEQYYDAHVAALEAMR